MGARIITFADGFTSASAPTVTAGTNESYVINNGVSPAANITGLVFSSATYSSVFCNFELERIETGTTYRQSGSAIFFYNGTSWGVSFGAFSGDELIQDTITNPQDVILTITPAGQVQYESGTMGSGYSGKLKLDIVRIAA